MPKMLKGNPFFSDKIKKPLKNEFSKAFLINKLD